MHIKIIEALDQKTEEQLEGYYNSIGKAGIKRNEDTELPLKIQINHEEFSAHLYNFNYFFKNRSQKELRDREIKYLLNIILALKVLTIIYQFLIVT